MPRPQSENTFQVAFKIPQQWVEMADEIAAAMSRPGIATTRTDALRAALWEGLTRLRAETTPSATPAAANVPQRRTTITGDRPSKPKKR
jgi:hypothetical protein